MKRKVLKFLASLYHYETLVIVSHPYPAQSRIIKTLEKKLVNSENISIRNLETLYGHDLALD